jgi:hypothetical protein
MWGPKPSTPHGYGVYVLHGAFTLWNVPQIRRSKYAVPSIANERATGVLVLARWSVAGADVVFARSNAY